MVFVSNEGEAVYCAKSTLIAKPEFSSVPSHPPKNSLEASLGFNLMQLPGCKLHWTQWELFVGMCKTVLSVPLNSEDLLLRNLLHHAASMLRNTALVLWRSGKRKVWLKKAFLLRVTNSQLVCVQKCYLPGKQLVDVAWYQRNWK